MREGNFGFWDCKWQTAIRIKVLFKMNLVEEEGFRFQIALTSQRLQ